MQSFGHSTGGRCSSYYFLWFFFYHQPGFYRRYYHVWQISERSPTRSAYEIPIIESVHKRVSIQNRSVELEFQAVTQDQANVYFKSMLLYSVQNADEETIKKVAFKFIADKD